MGRKMLKARDQEWVTITSRCTAEEYAQAKECARLDDRTMTQFVRIAVREKVQRIMAGQTWAELNKMMASIDKVEKEEGQKGEASPESVVAMLKTVDEFMKVSNAVLSKQKELGELQAKPKGKKRGDES